MATSITVARDIKATVSRSPPISVSTSPATTFRSLSFHSSNSSFPNLSHNSYFPYHQPVEKQLKPFATEDIKILLLENINESARTVLEKEGYQVEFYNHALTEDELIDKLKDIHVLGIRSHTALPPSILKRANFPNLLAIGTFCIGTPTASLLPLARLGIPVFNSPFSSSRSVAELTIANIIILARQLLDRNAELHNGQWNKVSAHCWEVRGKTLGIVGYGHIGSQLSVLAEAMGMVVIFYDTIPVMALGKAKQVATLDELLIKADFLTLHVPEVPETNGLIGAAQLAKMKSGSYILNASHGSILDIPSLVSALRSKHLGGAALDVFPAEPGVNGNTFEGYEELAGLPNVVLTPHIGGATEEAQRFIGNEVAEALVRFVNSGSTVGAVNLPEVALRGVKVGEEGSVRVIFIHWNRPGVLRQVNGILKDHNVDKQMSDSRGEVAYLMADISCVKEEEIKCLYDNLESLTSKIMTRLLY